MTMKTAFNLAAAMREALEENPEYTGPECRKWIEHHYPDANPKENSMGVAYSKQRRKMGLMDKQPVGGDSGFLEVLTAAKDLVEQCGGNEEKAHEAVSAIVQIMDL